MSIASNKSDLLVTQVGVGHSVVETPEFFDDFSTYSPGQTITTGTVSPTGQAYTFVDGGGNHPPTISNGRLIGTESSTYYLGIVLNGPVQQIGANVVFYPGTGVAGYTVGAILICPNNHLNTGSLDALIHITFSRTACGVAVATSGGVGGLVTIGTLTLKNNFLPLNDVETGTIVLPVVVTIWGNTLELTYGGGDPLTITDSRIGTVNGKYIYWEQFSAGAQLDLIAYSTFWANPNPIAALKICRAAQQWSYFLDLLAAGSLRAPVSATVGNFATGYAQTGVLDVLGDICAVGGGRLKSVVGATTGAPHAAPLTAGSSLGPYGSGGTSGQEIFAYTIGAGTLPAIGALFRIIYRGKFAANVNNKRLYFNALGNLFLDTGAVAFNGGEWTMTIDAWRDGANNTQFQGFLFTNSSVIVTSETYAGSLNVSGVPGNWGVGIFCDTSVANDIIFYGQWNSYEDNQ